MQTISTAASADAGALATSFRHDLRGTGLVDARRQPSRIYLIGEQPAARHAAVPGRKMVSINGRWKSLAGTVATFEQILEIAYAGQDLGRALDLSVTYRRGDPIKPRGSLSRRDAVPIVDGMLFIANATILS